MHKQTFGARFLMIASVVMGGWASSLAFAACNTEQQDELR